MSPEIRPKSFRTFEKQAPGIHYILFPFSVVASSFSSLNKPRGFKYLLYLPSEAGLGYFDSDCCQYAEIETLFNTSQIEPNQEIKLGRRGENRIPGGKRFRAEQTIQTQPIYGDETENRTRLGHIGGRRVLVATPTLWSQTVITRSLPAFLFHQNISEGNNSVTQCHGMPGCNSVFKHVKWKVVMCDYVKY